MAAYDFSGRRLFVRADLDIGRDIELDRDASNYVLSVLRLGSGGDILLFNGRDGEWLARVSTSGRKAAILSVIEPVRAQTAPGDLLFLFAPLKHARLDYLVQKAVEMGAGAIRPVFTRRTVASRVNRDRMEANIVEAAEQCGVLSVPALLSEADLAGALAELGTERRLVFCDEDAPPGSSLAALRAGGSGPAPLAVLVGPEGGFDPEERRLVLQRPDVVRLSLGPRILRADTAAVAALAIVQATLGDWR